MQRIVVMNNDNVIAHADCYSIEHGGVLLIFDLTPTGGVASFSTSAFAPGQWTYVGYTEV